MKISKLPIITLFTLSLFFISQVFAQPGRSEGKDKSQNQSFMLLGKVVDDKRNPLEYVTILLLNQKDSAAVNGSVTNAKGVFEIEAKAGVYILKVQFLGYESQFISGVELSEDKPFVNLKEVSLVTKETTLEEVDIVAEKSRMEFALDKRVFNVGQDLANIGGNASDLLDNIPSLTVDIDGEVSLRGSANVRILINGKPSGFTSMNSADALQQLPSSMIEKVEIITNPSSRYEAEGTAGIINIILKKERKKGWNGSFDLTGGIPHAHNASININHRREKLNFFTSVGGRYRKTPRNYSEYRETFDPDDLSNKEITDQIGKTFRSGLSGNIRLGADYSINKYTTITGSVHYRDGNDLNESDITYDFQTANRELTSSRLRSTEELEDEYSLDYSLNFERTFARKGQKLTADIIFTRGNEIEDMDAIDQNFAPNGVRIRKDDLQNILNDEDERETTLMLDYVHPFAKDGKFEIGYRGGIRNIDNSLKVSDFVDSLALWELQDNLSNDFAYRENIHAIYSSFGNKHGKFSYQVGLRGEYTDIQTHLVKKNEKNNKDYLNVFPSLFLNYELKPGSSIQWSYSRRLRRPRFHDLNPFFSYSNPLSVRSGNPDLNPEFSHSFDLNYIKYWDKVTLSTGVYYRHTDGAISRVAEVIGSLDGKPVVLSRSQNLNTEDNAGMEMSLDLALVKWWDMNFSTNIYYSKINGKNLGFARTTEFLGYTSRLNSKIKLPKDIDMQIMVNYRGPSQSPNSKRKAILYTDFGINKDILKKKATVSLRISDIFNTMKYRYESFGQTFYSYREGQWRARRQVYIGFSYRLNQKKRQRRERVNMEMGGEDM